MLMMAMMTLMKVTLIIDTRLTFKAPTQIKGFMNSFKLLLTVYKCNLF